MATAYIELPSGTVLETQNPNCWPEGKRLTRKDGAARLKEEARAELLDLLPPGSTVYTVLRHCSRSGMYRRISLFVIAGGDPINEEQSIMSLDGYALRLGIGERPRKGDGIGVGGCGMDMGFHLVYTLSDALHGDGYALKHRWL